MLLSLSARHTGDNSKPALDALIALWWRKFGDLPDGILVPAFELALDTCTFFPSIAEFHGLIRTVAASEGAVVDGATAWEAIERDIIGRWSETGDRLLASTNRKYPWPDDRSREILRDEMGYMEIVREWLQALEEGRATGEQFDQQITGRAMFLFCVCFGHHDQYYPRLCVEIDRRKAMIGFRYCAWRGWVPVHEYDRRRHDRARERAALASKYEVGR
jgi:hypothetical protein